MHPNYRARYSPSGPFMGGAGELEGFVRRAFDFSNLAPVSVPEGGAWTTLVEVPIVLAASDPPVSELSWIVEGWANFTVEQPTTEEPQTFPISTVLQCENDTGIASTPIVRSTLSWPWCADDLNVQINSAHARFLFNDAFAFEVGTNYFRLQLAFFGGGAHTAEVGGTNARLSVIELGGPEVSYT